MYPKIPCIRFNFDFVYFTGTNRNSLSKKSFSQLPVTDIECRLDRRFLLIRMFARPHLTSHMKGFQLTTLAC